ncbi:MAG: hypothetical protein WC762_13400 [Methylobacter sp.]|jgi:hypothetical protein
MPLFQNDTVDLLKKDGTRVVDLKASVQRTKIYMNAGKLLIESGDLIQRRMSNGAEETYQVIDPGFYEAFHGIPANYQMEVQKLGTPEAKQAVQSITYNITGSNARINQNSVDNSTNVVHIDARAIQHVAVLRSEVDKLPLPEEEKAAAHDIINTVEEQFKSGRPNKTVVNTLLSALPHIAEITSIVGDIVGLL